MAVVRAPRPLALGSSGDGGSSRVVLAILLAAWLSAGGDTCRSNVGDGCFEPGDKSHNHSSCCPRAASPASPKPGACDCAQPFLTCNYTSKRCMLAPQSPRCPAEGDYCAGDGDCIAKPGCFAAMQNRTDKPWLANHSSCCPYAAGGGNKGWWSGGLHCNVSRHSCERPTATCSALGQDCSPRASKCCPLLLCAQCCIAVQ